MSKTITVDPDKDYPREGDTIAYIADNEASFGGVVEESYQDPEGQCRFRIIGHDGLFLHEAEAWRSRYISRPQQQWEPGTVGTATLNNRVSGNSSRGLQAMRYRNQSGAEGFAFENGVQILDGATTYSVTDFVPDGGDTLRAEFDRAVALSEARQNEVERLEAELHHERTAASVTHAAFTAAVDAVHAKDDRLAVLSLARVAKDLLDNLGIEVAE